MGSTGLGKYGNGRTHDPRCNCPDCNAAFVMHNTKEFRCECIDCVAHREIFAPPPRVTRPDEIAAAQYERGREMRARDARDAEIRARDARDAANIKRYHQQQKRGKKTMGNLNICERPGCNAIIKGEAAARVELEPNTQPDAERKLYVLCPPCVSDVDTLLHTVPTEDRERAYDKPYEGYETPRENDDVKAASTEQLAAELFERLMRDAVNKTKVLGRGTMIDGEGGSRGSTD